MKLKKSIKIVSTGLLIILLGFIFGPVFELAGVIVLAVGLYNLSQESDNFKLAFHLSLVVIGISAAYLIYYNFFAQNYDSTALTTFLYSENLEEAYKEIPAMELKYYAVIYVKAIYTLIEGTLLTVVLVKTYKGIGDYTDHYFAEFYEDFRQATKRINYILLSAVIIEAFNILTTVTEYNSIYKFLSYGSYNEEAYNEYVYSSLVGTLILSAVYIVVWIYRYSAVNKLRKYTMKLSAFLPVDKPIETNTTETEPNTIDAEANEVKNDDYDWKDRF